VHNVDQFQKTYFLTRSFLEMVRLVLGRLDWIAI